MIRFKRYKWDNQTYHQVLVNGRVIGSLQKQDRWWFVSRLSGVAETKKDAAKKLIEARIGDKK